MLTKKAKRFQRPLDTAGLTQGRSGANVFGCILVENEYLAIEMMQEYIHTHENLLLLGIAQTLAELRHMTIELKPEIIFLDLIIPSGGYRDFDYGMLPDHATVVVVSGIPLALYDKKHLLKNPIELPKPVSHESFNNCVERVIKERKREACR